MIDITQTILFGQAEIVEKEDKFHDESRVENNSIRNSEGVFKDNAVKIILEALKLQLFIKIFFFLESVSFMANKI